MASSGAAVKNGAPRLSKLSASEIARTRAKLTATIDPRGSSTTYSVWLAHPAGCSKDCEKVDQEEVGTGTVAPGKPQTVVVSVTELPANTRCTFWLEASNASGEAMRSHRFKTER